MSEPLTLTPRMARLLPWLVAIAFFMQTLGGTILNTALPGMARSLNEDPLRMQGVVIAYLLTVALLGGISSLQFTAMNTLTLIDLRDDNASAGNSLLSVVMQLSIGLGVACAAALLGGFNGDMESARGDVLSALHATYLSVGLLSMLAAAIFFQLNAEDGRITPRRIEPEHDVSEH